MYYLLSKIFLEIIQQFFFLKRKPFGIKIIKEDYKSDNYFGKNIILLEKTGV